MATAKKKPSAAQLAARKLFAQRAKAGTLTKKRKTATKAKPARKTAVKKAAPIKRAVTHKTYGLYIGPNRVAIFRDPEMAKNFAQAYADTYGISVGVK